MSYTTQQSTIDLKISNSDLFQKKLKEAFPSSKISYSSFTDIYKIINNTSSVEIWYYKDKHSWIISRRKYPWSYNGVLLVLVLIYCIGVAVFKRKNNSFFINYGFLGFIILFSIWEYLYNYLNKDKIYDFLKEHNNCVSIIESLGTRNSIASI